MSYIRINCKIYGTLHSTVLPDHNMQTALLMFAEDIYV